MTPEEYNNTLKGIQAEYNTKLQFLDKEYALSNSPYQVGDIVTDHIGSLKIETIKYTRANTHLTDMPQCVYFGIELKKDGTPMKKQTSRGVYQTNIIKS